jgi:bifunctional oligoribonuclease and PAP phosphatase NrnA
MIDRVAEILRQGRRFLVTMHREPDGDALGSSLALACALREMGKDVVHYNPDPAPYNLRFLPGCEHLIRTVPDGAFDATLVCDTPRPERLGDGLPEGGVLVNIDHHRGPGFGDVQLVDPNAAASGVMVFRLLRHLGHAISRDVAHGLYASILTDTGSFRYDSTDPESLRITADLIAAGVRPWQMASQIYESQPAARVHLLAQTLATLEVTSRGRLASLVVTQEMLQACGASPDMLDGFVNHARAVDGVEVALLLVEQDEGVFHATFRSRGNVDLTVLGKRLGGKGATNGASAFLTGTLQEVKERAARAVGGLFEVADTAVA